MSRWHIVHRCMRSNWYPRDGGSTQLKPRATKREMYFVALCSTPPTQECIQVKSCLYESAYSTADCNNNSILRVRDSPSQNLELEIDSERWSGWNSSHLMIGLAAVKRSDSLMKLQWHLTQWFFSNPLSKLHINIHLPTPMLSFVCWLLGSS